MLTVTLPDYSGSVPKPAPPVPPGERAKTKEAQKVALSTVRLFTEAASANGGMVQAVARLCKQWMAHGVGRGRLLKQHVRDHRHCDARMCAIHNIGNYVYVCLESGKLHLCGTKWCDNAQAVDERGATVCPITALRLGAVIGGDYESQCAVRNAAASAERAAKRRRKDLRRKDEQKKLKVVRECDDRYSVFVRYVLCIMPVATDDELRLRLVDMYSTQQSRSAKQGYGFPFDLASVTRKQVAQYVASLAEHMWHLLESCPTFPQLKLKYTAVKHVIVVLHLMCSRGYKTTSGRSFVPSAPWLRLLWKQREDLLSADDSPVAHETTHAEADFKHAMDALSSSETATPCGLAPQLRDMFTL